MNLTIDQIQELGELEKKIAVLTQVKTKLTAQVTLSDQSNQTKLNSIFETVFNNALTQKSQKLTAQNINELSNWERSNINMLSKHVENAYTEFLHSSMFNQLVLDFVKQYNIESNEIKITTSSDLQNKLTFSNLPNIKLDCDSKLDPMSINLDFGEVMSIDMSFDSVKEQILPILISQSIKLV
jgi:hypothetical protein